MSVWLAREDAERLLRRALAETTGRPADAWRFGRSADRRRTIDADAPCFSLSRAEGWAAVAISDEPVGVDIETRARVSACAKPDDRWLSAVEGRDVAAAADPVAALACRWTLKEALGKALGTGLPPAPEHWSFHTGPAGLSCPAHPRARLALFVAGPTIGALALIDRRAGEASYS